ncbi:MAG TPA: HIT family protein [Steroidobacteraceae bacterium]|jgi:histidine triad (HIT) family protein|nr:HIT family protein [Steroidobacteraceae bacterium]
MSYDSNNVFAKILRGEIPAFKVYEDEHTLAFMDVMPQSDGHTLVIPKVTASNLFEIQTDALGRLIAATQRIAGAAQRAFNADGVTIMQFNGAAAGQTVFHLHFHVIPRYEGTPLRSHAREMADAKLLAAHAEQLKQALANA